MEQQMTLTKALQENPQQNPQFIFEVHFIAQGAHSWKKRKSASLGWG
jgi:hypothetical protein